jgi:ABC-2 type transport system permease protein
MAESFEARSARSGAFSATRPLYWSVRRELWESRSIYIAPLAAAAAFLFGFLISTIYLPSEMRSLSALDPARQREVIATPYDMAAGLLMGTAMIVGMFYCLGALQSERRDRSILFWKSLPVSDRITVLSKASIPLVLLPLLTFAITVVLQSLIAVVQHCSAVGERSECRSLVEAVVISPNVAAAALPSCNGACALARTNLRLAAADLRLGAARGVFVGDLTAVRDRLPGEASIQHVASRGHARGPS